MEKEKAIEIFNKWIDCKDAYQAEPSCDGNCFSCEYYASAEEEKEAMLLAISALEKQEQDRWIPVTEKLPKKDCKCRVTEGDFKSVIDCCWNNYKKQFEVWSYYHDDYMPITNVTAWKLIEAPYTEEES